jgi:selenocysteine lyase/cysteine desulfurase
VGSWKNQVCLRVSAQIYNEMKDIVHLIEALTRAS